AEQAEMVSRAPAPLVRELQAAGWTRPEIARVLLALPDIGADDVAIQDVEEGPTASGTSISRGEAASSGVVDTLPMARSLARILTGTEALSAPDVRGDQSPGLSSPGLSSRYFGTAAPERAPLFSGLREAIGELLALAQTSLGVTDADSSGPGETSRRQLSTAIGRLSTVADVPVRSGYGTATSDQRSWVDLSAHPEPASLASRLTAALETSGRGPAGVERLAAALSRVASPAGPEQTPAGPIQAPGSGDVSLGATVAPETMLRGLVTPMAEGRTSGSTTRRGELPGTVIGLAQADRLPSGGRHRSLADFSGSWLRRVDGSRAGVDLGMDDTRAAFLDTFDGFADRSATGTMDLAASSPIEEASVVVPGSDTEAPTGQGKGAASRRVRPTASTAPRSPAGVAQRGDWNWVNTASRSPGQTETMADGLSRSRSTVGGDSMPLIAPAMHAVAHSAMRSANTEEAPGQQAAPTPAPASTTPEPQPEAELSKEAFEDLAQRMADRISRRMRREKERRGQWT
ncbi:MAG: hypothetical protein VYE15_08285, partial [Myxococcota bacterium]|nr:hypothetical protein [Myxococcota bacterium]